MHLWEADHSYYCSEANYYSREPHTQHATWHSFASLFAASDLDMNMVFRFDWYEGEDWGATPFNGDVNYRNGRLMMFFMMQRKGIYACHEISVCRADEPAVIEFLRPRWDYMRELWQPLSEPGPT